CVSLHVYDRWLVVVCLHCLRTCANTPQWRQRTTATLGLALSSPVRMIHRIHRHTPHPRGSAQPTRPASLAYGNIFMIHIANLPYRRTACDQNEAHLPRCQTYLGVLAIARHQLGCSTSTAD